MSPQAQSAPRVEDAYALHQAGRLGEAETAYARYLAVRPDDALALTNAGALAISAGDAALAVARLERAVALAPTLAAARHNLGHALTSLDRPAEAVRQLERAVELDPALVGAHNSLGVALEACGRRDDAIAAFARAVELAPRFADAAANLGDLLTRNDQVDLALPAFDRALAADPVHVRARTGRAYARVLAGELAAGRTELETLASAQPDDAALWQTLATVRWWAGDTPSAEQAYRHAVRLAPHELDVHFGLAATLLAQGRFDEGWGAFEVRPDGCFGPPRRFAQVPLWDGKPLAGSLLLCADQGLGDVVQFARFAAAARRRVERIVLVCDGYWSTLAPLLAGVPGVDATIAETSAAESAAREAAARASVLSLPYLLGSGGATRADAVPYLAAPADRVERWRARLAGLSGPRVGLAWGSFVRKDLAYLTRSRFVPPAALAPLLEVEGVQFVSLQPGPLGGTAAFGPLAARVADFTAEFRDYADTAALIAGLDLVVSTDTSVVHVAGALGRPVLMLDRPHGCWRWRMQEHGERWYPSLRSFAQRRFGDWSAPVEAARDALLEWIGRSGAAGASR